MVIVCYVYLESEGKFARSFISNFEDFEVLDFKKMLTEEKLRILHLLTVTTNPGL